MCWMGFGTYNKSCCHRLRRLVLKFYVNFLLYAAASRAIPLATRAIVGRAARAAAMLVL